MITKVKLKIGKPYRAVPGSKIVNLVESLPWFKSQQGKLYHRVHSGKVFYRSGEYKHTAFTFKCGANGFLERGKLLAELPQPAHVCGICLAKK